MSAKAERISFGPPGKAEAGNVRTRSRGGPFRSRPLGVVRSPGWWIPKSVSCTMLSLHLCLKNEEKCKNNQM